MLVDSDSLTARGFAHLPAVLTAAQCNDLIALYSDPDRFRTRIDMQQYRFGRGEYQYFCYPLPTLVDPLRRTLYAALVPIANHWSDLLHTPKFPDTLDALLENC